MLRGLFGSSDVQNLRNGQTNGQVEKVDDARKDMDMNAPGPAVGNAASFIDDLRTEAADFAQELARDARTAATSLTAIAVSTVDEIKMIYDGRSAVRTEVKSIIAVAFVVGLIFSTSIYWTTSGSLERKYLALHEEKAALSTQLNRVRTDAETAVGVVKQLRFQVADASRRASGAQTEASSARKEAEAVKKAQAREVARARARAEEEVRKEAEEAKKLDPRLVKGNVVPRGRGNLAAAADAGILRGAERERRLSARAAKYVANNVFNMNIDDNTRNRRNHGISTFTFSRPDGYASKKVRIDEPTMVYDTPDGRRRGARRG